VTAAYGNMLPAAFLDIPTHGTLNIHPSLLPLYRGAAPVQRALQVGCDAHPCAKPHPTLPRPTLHTRVLHTPPATPLAAPPANPHCAAAGRRDHIGRERGVYRAGVRRGPRARAGARGCGRGRVGASAAGQAVQARRAAAGAEHQQVRVCVRACVRACAGALPAELHAHAQGVAGSRLQLCVVSQPRPCRPVWCAGCGAAKQRAWRSRRTTARRRMPPR
jgi:hypothetical protein